MCIFIICLEFIKKFFNHNPKYSNEYIILLLQIKYKLNLSKDDMQYIISLPIYKQKQCLRLLIDGYGYSIPNQLI